MRSADSIAGSQYADEGDLARHRDASNAAQPVGGSGRGLYARKSISMTCYTHLYLFSSTSGVFVGDRSLVRSGFDGG